MNFKHAAIRLPPLDAGGSPSLLGLATIPLVHSAIRAAAEYEISLARRRYEVSGTFEPVNWAAIAMPFGFQHVPLSKAEKRAWRIARAKTRSRS